MKQEKQERIDRILSAWDGAKSAEVPSFFYTRLRARMEKENANAPSESWYLKPVFVIATLLTVIIINAFIFFQLDGNTVASSVNDETIQSIAAEYNLSDNILEEINK